MANLDKAFRARYGVSLGDVVGVFHGTLDPSTNSEVAPRGSIYLRQGTNGELWVKAGDADNAWSLMAAASGDPDAIHDNVSAEISAIAAKTTLVADDVLLMEDSEAAYAKKKFTRETLRQSFNSHNAITLMFTDEVSSGTLQYFVTATQKTSSGWMTITQVPFRGTDQATPTIIYMSSLWGGGTGTYDIRLVDVTNGSAVIASLTGLSNVAWAEQNFGTLSNLPASRAIIEVQVQVNSVQNRDVSMSYFQMLF